MMATFTDEELAELTPYNAAAYDWFRLKAQGEGQTPPCWLCLSGEAKNEAQVGLADWLTRELKPIIPFTVETAEAYIQKHMVDTLAPKVELWKKAELAMKEHREEGNPRAFFA
jgi:hypothetical protein